MYDLIEFPAFQKILLDGHWGPSQLCDDTGKEIHSTPICSCFFPVHNQQLTRSCKKGPTFPSYFILIINSHFSFLAPDTAMAPQACTLTLDLELGPTIEKLCCKHIPHILIYIKWSK